MAKVIVMSKDIIKVLENMASELDGNVHNLNYGGCGIAAYQIHKHLSKHVDCRIKIVNGMEETDINNVLANNPEIVDSPDGSEWFWNDVDFHHVVVEAKIGKKKVIIDSTGIKPKKGYKYDGHKLMKGELPPSTLQKLNRNECNWNCSYNRKQNRKVNSIIGRHLKQLLQAV